MTRPSYPGYCFHLRTYLVLPVFSPLPFVKHPSRSSRCSDPVGVTPSVFRIRSNCCFLDLLKTEAQRASAIEKLGTLKGCKGGEMMRAIVSKNNQSRKRGAEEGRSEGDGAKRPRQVSDLSVFVKAWS